MSDITYVALGNAYESLNDADKYRMSLQDDHEFGILSIHGRVKKNKPVVSLFLVVNKSILKEFIK
jgi:hypothetical protein